MSGQSNDQISDESLMAYADGELSAAERRDIERVLAQAPEMRTRLDAFAGTGRHLSRLFDEAMQSPVPQRLIDTVRSTPIGAKGADVTIVDFAQARAAKRNWRVSTAISYAAAACVAFVIAGYGARHLLLDQQHAGSVPFGIAVTEQGQKIAGQDLAAALDTVVSSGEARKHDQGVAVTIKPVLSFATATGEYCRQYKVLRAAPQPSFAGVACRDGAAWRIEAHEAFAAKPGADSQIVVAGSDNPASVEAAIDKLISGDVLSVEDEAAALQRNWRAH